MIRSFHVQDADFIIESHYTIYQQEYQFDQTFREFIHDGISSFVEHSNPSKEEIWVVDIEGRLYGSIGITQLTDKTAQLRWFLIAPEQRGNGWGSKLMQTATQFCESKGYETIILWTNRRLEVARKIYDSFGFAIKETREQFLSNQLIKEECWELNLVK